MRTFRVVTAHRVVDGAVVYSGLDGWVENIRAASLEGSRSGLARRLATAQLDAELGLVRDVYVIDVEDHGLGPRPVRPLERLRATGIGRGRLEAARLGARREARAELMP